MSANTTRDDSYHKRMALTYGSIKSHVKERALEMGYGNKRGGVNIDKLARESGISTATLYYLFSRPDTFRTLNFITAAKLCKVLNADIGDLFSYVPGISSESLGIDVSTFENLKGATR